MRPKLSRSTKHTDEHFGTAFEENFKFYEEESEIDWHDYAFMEYESSRIGLGEHGVAAEVPENDKDKAESISLKYGYNALLSDRISLNRSVPDIRHQEYFKRF